MKFLSAHKRWFIGGFITLTLALLVWFVGPLVGAAGEPHPLDPVGARLVVIAVLVLIWLGIEGLRVMLARRRNRKMVEQLAADTEDASMSREESAALRTRFTEAMSTLKGARIGGGGGASSGKLLYQLPWYMFIGAPGSGKTTALINSGLRFPLAASAGSASALGAIGGIGGTRNCDWWFTDEAVLIDTAGRYTTQDSNQNVDQSAWKTFLGLLKRFRPRQPINGIIVTLSVGDLFAFDAAERTRYAQTVRQRVDELQSELGLDFPVYVMVTKCDLIAGFSEFFSNFDADQRAQVWGMTFDFDIKTRVAEDAKNGFDLRFQSLVAKVNELLLPRLQEERDTERRAGMYAFPQQFGLVGPLISEFLDAAFGHSKFSGKAIVRGVYFTSGTQQGAPIDRLVGALSKQLDLSRQRSAGLPVGSAKSYFITRLMKEVVFPEARLAGFNEAREVRLTRISWGATAAVTALSLLLIGAWGWSYVRNSSALTALQPQVGATVTALAAIGQPTNNDMADLSAALDQLRALPTKIADPVDSPPLGMRWGLYQGRNVDDQVSERYRNAVYTGLLPRLALRLERIMADGNAKPEQVYAALKTYVMLYEPKHIDADWLRGYTTLMWGAEFGGSGSEALRESLQAHTATLIDGRDLQAGKFHERNQALVQQARERMAKSPLADLAYSFLKLTDGAAAPGVRLSEAVGPVGVSIFERSSGRSLAEPIPMLFTREGYNTLVKGRLKTKAEALAKEEEWVMGERSSGVGRSNMNDLVAEVQQRYFDDYRKTWNDVLADIRLKPLNGIGDSIDVARKLTQSDSPLRRLITTANEQTTLTAPVSAAGAAVTKAATDAAKQATQSTASTLGGSLFGSGAGAAGVAAIDANVGTKSPEAQFDVDFAVLRRLAGDGKTGEINEAMQLITEVYNELIAVDQKVKSGQASADASAGLARMKTSADRFPPPVGGMIKALTGTGAGEAKAAAAKDTKEAMAGAAATCKKLIDGKYPFSRTAAVDVGVTDFVNVFKSGGELDTFFGAKLAPLVDKSGSAWRFKTLGDAAPPVSSAALAQFQNAEAIRSAFLGGGAAPAVTVDVSVFSSEGEVTLDYDGLSSKMKVNSGAVRLVWPPTKPGPAVKLSLGTQVIAQADGQWAVFRLLDKGAVDPAGSGGDRLRVTYGGGKVTLDFKATSAAFNPFRLRELNTFACPQP